LIAIIDYGVGNLASVEKALQYIGLNAAITSDPDVIRRSDGVVLPGVGAFSDAMKSLVRAGMVDVVRESVRENKLFLGIPHMGWNSLKKGDSPLFRGLPENPYVYFVHSYYLEATDRSMVAATCDYGLTFDAAIQKGRVFATQFHPEKSGEIGLAILRNWAGML